MMTLKEMQDFKKNSGLSNAEISEQSGVPFGTVQKDPDWSSLSLILLLPQTEKAESEDTM